MISNKDKENPAHDDSEIGSIDDDEDGVKDIPYISLKK